MEAHDAFGQGVEVNDEHDPFSGSDFGDFEPPTEIPAATEGLPVVNKEGDRIDEPAAEQPAADEPVFGEPPAQPADGASAESQEGEAAQAPPQAPQAAPAPAEVAQEAVAAEEPQPPEPEPQAGLPTLTPEQQEAKAREYPERTGMAPVEPEASADPTPASSEPSPPAEPEPEDAPAPAETTDKRGRTTQRRYVILRVDGPGKFSQVSWYEDDKGKMTSRGPGAKRQTVALARDAEGALKIGYAAAGAPADGITLIAVAAAYFQAKQIKPMPPEPSRQRLQIS